MNIKEMEAAIAIFRKYVETTKDIFHAEHDYLWGPHIDYLRRITDEDTKALERLGWDINGDDCWQHCCSC